MSVPRDGNAGSLSSGNDGDSESGERFGYARRGGAASCSRACQSFQIRLNCPYTNRTPPAPVGSIPLETVSCGYGRKRNWVSVKSNQNPLPLSCRCWCILQRRYDSQCCVRGQPFDFLDRHHAGSESRPEFSRSDRAEHPRRHFNSFSNICQEIRTIPPDKSSFACIPWLALWFALRVAVDTARTAFNKPALGQHPRNSPSPRRSLSIRLDTQLTGQMRICTTQAI